MVTKATNPGASLGVAQEALEDATRKLTAAQNAYIKALNTLTEAEEVHNRATIALVEEVSVVRTRARVQPVALK